MENWIYEDELPELYPYDDAFKLSKVIDGVRMFPPVMEHEHDWHLSMDGSTFICDCGAWK